MKPNWRPPSKRPEMQLQKQPAPDGQVCDLNSGDPWSDVGQSFRLDIERHKLKPKLWRLRYHQIAADGTELVKRTEWQEFPDFSPHLLLAKGLLQRFIFGDQGTMAQAQRRT